MVARSNTDWDRYEPDEIDPTRMAQEPNSDDDEDGEEGWEQVDPESDGDGDGDQGEVMDYVILSKPFR